MSWREICKIQATSKHSIPRWLASDAHRELALAARRRIFGGTPLAGMSDEGRKLPLGKKNRALLQTKEKQGLLNQLEWPFVRPELMSGRAYREREKLQAKVQAGLKGIAAGQAEAEKDKKKKK